LEEFGLNRFVLEIKVAGGPPLICRSIADNGWTATIHDLSTGTTKPANLVAEPKWDSMHLYFDKAGEYRVEFEYNPIEFWIGAWVSSIGWLGGSLYCVALLRRRKSVS
jgi:hypothetical protein